MAEFKGIPILPQQQAAKSGDKYTTAHGFTAIKDGSRPARALPLRRRDCASRRGCVPLWVGPEFAAVQQIVREHRLSTVCEEAKCPNIGECWNAGTATIMLMGAVCTRACASAPWTPATARLVGCGRAGQRRAIG